MKKKLKASRNLCITFLIFFALNIQYVQAFPSQLKLIVDLFKQQQQIISFMISISK